jgi:hypothetical protein
MKRNRALGLGFALLLTLLSPIEGYAAMPGCTARMVSHQQRHCPAAPAHHHDCGGCLCAAAVALSSMPWIAPLLSVAAAWDSPSSAPPQVELDRLDRPPRFARA